MTNLREAFEKGWNYPEYRRMLKELRAEGRTTGHDQSEAILQYADLNEKRMDRGEKTVKLSEDILRLSQSADIRENWLVLTEGWCGDASQILPVLAKIEEGVDGISMRMILRDENPGIMDKFLTNGTRSIPKVIRLNPDTYEVLGAWGPRPQEMQSIVDEWKNSSDEIPKSEMYVRVHGAYAKDRGLEVMKEFSEILNRTYEIGV